MSRCPSCQKNQTGSNTTNDPTGPSSTCDSLGLTTASAAQSSASDASSAATASSTSDSLASSAPSTTETASSTESFPYIVVKNFPHSWLMTGTLIEEGGMMSRIPREDDTVQISIMAKGFLDIVGQQLSIVEVPPEEENGDYPTSLSKTPTQVPDFLNLKPDNDSVAPLQLQARNWMTVDGNNRQVGVQRATDAGRIPVCTYVTVR